MVRRKYANLSGEGAKLNGGRFNPPGIRAIYTSQSIALALLEVLVHIDKAEAPIDYVVMAVHFAGRSASRPHSAKVAKLSQLTPMGFRGAFHNRPILRVPSDIIPREFNYVLFPEAAGFRASLDWIEPLDFDSRLVASIGR